MDYWETCLDKDLADWLLSGEPWVIYRTLTDLLDAEEGDGSVLTARKKSS